MATVSSHQQGAFSNPQNGQTADASVVLGNDNALRVTTNAHDADATIHVQSSVLASRPAAGTAQRVWITTDGLRAYVDSGSVWGELAYLPLAAGGTVGGALTVSTGGLTVAGGITVSDGNVTLPANLTLSGATSLVSLVTANSGYRLAYSADPTNFYAEWRQDNPVGGVVRFYLDQVNNGTSYPAAIMVDRGAVTLSSKLTVTTGGVTVSAGGITVTGNSTITGTLGGLTGLTVASGGITVTAGDVTVSSGQITASGIIKAAQQGMFGAYSGTGDAGSLAVSNNTIASASAGAATLPPTPAGFFAWHLGGTSVKIPYYN